jgi:pyrroloquinoline quinone (PQQ) biosynthesis protein C/mannose-6-phosphate isomerase-like protein (cupin superfamily)
MAAWISDSKIPIVDPSAAAALGGSMRRAEDSVPPSSRGISSEERRRRPTVTEPPTETLLTRLHLAQAEHPFWQNRLFRAAAAGALTKEDFALVFSQYYLYSQSFTRYLAALMANCENDLHRAKLAENIWEEGGKQAPSERHAEIFRRFLREGLGVDDRDIEFLDGTRFFVREFLDFCLHAHPVAASAFLSLGTEGIVPRMYAVFLDGLRKAGIPEEHLGFFRLHMECDDAHAETLERIMTSYASMPDWLATCQHSMDYALSLRARFFEQLFDAIESRRVRRILGNIQRAVSLAAEEPDPSGLVHRRGAPSLPLYGNVSDRLNIDFSVERIPFAADVFDARILRIGPHKNNERHKHPHESIFYVISGKGRVTVNKTTVDVGPGDLVFVPRWALHQSVSTSDEELVILAITDFGLTEQAYIGDHLRTTRLKGSQIPRPRA